MCKWNFPCTSLGHTCGTLLEIHWDHFQRVHSSSKRCTGSIPLGHLYFIAVIYIDKENYRLGSRGWAHAVQMWSANQGRPSRLTDWWSKRRQGIWTIASLTSSSQLDAAVDQNHCFPAVNKTNFVKQCICQKWCIATISSKTAIILSGVEESLTSSGVE